jgi:hypothetical protein
MKGVTIEHGYVDGTTTNTTSTELVWNSSGAAASTTWVKAGVDNLNGGDASGNNNDFGAVITIHVHDNTVVGDGLAADGDLTITIQHATDGAGTGAAEFGTDLLWPAASKLTNQTLGSKQVAANPGTDNTEGWWRLTATPTGVSTGELSVLCSVAIVPYSLFT